MVMIANVNPAHSTYEDSHNTLKYANRAKEIRMTESKINTETKVVCSDKLNLRFNISFLWNGNLYASCNFT